MLNVNVNVGGVVESGPGEGDVQGEARPRSDDGLYGDCTSLNMPPRFSSFRSFDNMTIPIFNM